MVAICTEGRGREYTDRSECERANLDGITSSNTVHSMSQPCLYEKASIPSVVIGATTVSVNILSLLSGPIKVHAGA
jgi:hypothetical protein